MSNKSKSAADETAPARKALPPSPEVTEEDMMAFHPTIRNIVFAPNHFVALGLEPRADYTDADIEAAYMRKVAELNEVVDSAS